MTICEDALPTVDQPDRAQAWQELCAVSDLVLHGGIAARIDGEQVALFHVPDCEEAVFAIGNLDPACGVGVLSRGIVGDVAGRLVVASPMYKHHFDLRNGRCLEDVSLTVPVWRTRVADDRVMVCRPVS